MEKIGIEMEVLVAVEVVLPNYECPAKMRAHGRVSSGIVVVSRQHVTYAACVSVKNWLGFSELAVHAVFQTKMAR